MRSVSILVLGWMAVFCAYTGSLQAKMVSGEISEINMAAGKLTVVTTDSATGNKQNSDVWIQEGTDLLGMALNEFRKGDEVWIEGEEDIPTGGWKAFKVARI